MNFRLNQIPWLHLYLYNKNRNRKYNVLFQRHPLERQHSEQCSELQWNRLLYQYLHRGYGSWHTFWLKYEMGCLNQGYSASLNIQFLFILRALLTLKNYRHSQFSQFSHETTTIVDISKFTAVWNPNSFILSGLYLAS